MTPLHQSIHEQLSQNFASRGMVFLGNVDLNVDADFERFSAWIDTGHHATMDFLARNRELRRHADSILPGVKSAIIFGLPYAEPLKSQTSDSTPRIAKYARISDYHRIMWREGESAFRGAIEKAAPECPSEKLEPDEFRVCVDSAPLLERALAAKTGVGFIGKNTCFIAARDGSFMLLGVILTRLEIPLTQHESRPKSRKNHNDCGGCKRCQVHCPTGALDTAYNLDSRKCLSYWTIEHRGTIPEQFWPWLSRYWYGCDICQDVCPYNRTATKLTRMDLLRPVSQLRLADVATMDQVYYEKNFGGTAMTRAKRNGLRRNAMIAMTVTNDPSVADALARAKTDDDPMIRQTAEQIERWLKKDSASEKK